MFVSEIMSQNVRTCHATESLADAARIMWEADCGVVPIVDDDAHVIGMVTDRDVAMAAYTQGKPLPQIQCDQVMARSIVSCNPTDPIDLAEELMQEAQIRRVPVVDDEGHLRGILSLNDIVRGATPGGRFGAPLPHEIVGTLAAIGRPRDDRH